MKKQYASMSGRFSPIVQVGDCVALQENIGNITFGDPYGQPAKSAGEITSIVGAGDVNGGDLICQIDEKSPKCIKPQAKPPVPVALPLIAEAALVAPVKPKKRAKAKSSKKTAVKKKKASKKVVRKPIPEKTIKKSPAKRKNKKINKKSKTKIQPRKKAVKKSNKKKRTRK